MATTPNVQGKIATLTGHNQRMTAHIVQLNEKIRTLDEKIQVLGGNMREAQSKANVAAVAHYRQMAQFAIQQRNQLTGYVRQNMSMVRKISLIIQGLQKQQQKQQQPAKTRGGKKANRKTRRN